MKINLILLSLLFVFPACYYDNASELHPAAGLDTNCDTTNVTYNNTVSPIFGTSCGTNNSCHSAALANGGVILESYDKAILVDDNLLIGAIDHTGPKPMPQPSGKLSDCNINLIKIWIQNGKPE